MIPLVLVAVTAAHAQSSMVDTTQLIRVADSVGVPRVVMLSVAWEESRAGNKPNNLIIGMGREVYDSITHTNKRVCREIGRMQLSPCINWTWVDKSCTRTGLRNYHTNIVCGAALLKRYKDSYGDWRTAIRRYNGSGRISYLYRNRVLTTIKRFCGGILCYEDTNNRQ